MKENEQNRPKRDLAALYDYLFSSLELLKESSHTALDANVKRAAAVRQTASAIIDAAKLEVQVHKMKKSSSLDGLFPNLDGMKQLGDGEETGAKASGVSGAKTSSANPANSAERG